MIDLEHLSPTIYWEPLLNKELDLGQLIFKERALGMSIL